MLALTGQEAVKRLSGEGALRPYNDWWYNFRIKMKELLSSDTMFAFSASRTVHPHAERGLTLMELMIVLTLVAIMTGLAVPAYREMAVTASYNRSSETLEKAIGLARNEAIYRGSQVTICAQDPSTGDTDATCNTNQSNWGDGLMVFMNCDGTPGKREQTTSVCDLDGDGTVDSPEPLLRIFPPVDSDIQPDQNSQTALTFNPTGFIDKPVEFALSYGSATGDVTISRTGHVISSRNP